MSIAGWLQIILILALVVVAAVPLGGYIVRALAGEHNFLSPVLAPVERGLYRAADLESANPPTLDSGRGQTSKS